MELLKSHQITVPKGFIANNSKQVLDIASNLSKDVVIKAQVLAGGRGKGHFTSGLKGGVKMCFKPSQAEKYAEKMLGSKLITKQTGAAGRPCNKVFISD